jgi:hypothetical protein
VNGTSSSVGVKGISGSGSQISFGSANGGAGVWGDTNVTGGVAVVGTVKEGIGVWAINYSTDTTTPALQATSATNGLVFRATGTSASCTIDGSANLACSGSKSAVVPVNAGQKMVALYAVEAPENWFEDYDSGQLASGAATVTLDPTYAQTVNTDMQYLVFLTPTARACMSAGSLLLRLRFMSWAAGTPTSRLTIASSPSAGATSKSAWPTKLK